MARRREPFGVTPMYDCSVFLAQLIGLYAFLMCLAMLLHPQRWKKMMTEFLGHTHLITLSGSLALLFGLVIVLVHNLWVSDWRVLITLVGWLVLLQGIWRFFFPEHFAKITKEMFVKSGYQVWTWIWLLVGIYLIWVGFTQNG